MKMTHYQEETPPASECFMATLNQSQAFNVMLLFCAPSLLYVHSQKSLEDLARMVSSVEDGGSIKLEHYHPTRVLTLIYQPFGLVTIAVLTYNVAIFINPYLSTLFGCSINFICSSLIIALDLATSGKGGTGTYTGLCAISGAFGVADALIQGGMVGDLSLMCPELMQSYMAGLAVSGAVTSALRLITKAGFESSENGLRKGAIMFFAISTFVELLCVLLYAFVSPKLPIVKYYRSKAALEGSKTVADDLAAAGIKTLPSGVEKDTIHSELLSKKQLFIQNIDYAANMFFIYVLTLSIFPGFLSEDTGSHSLGSWYALVLIAVFNAFDLIGRYIPLIKSVKLKSRGGLTIATLSRFLLVPVYYFTVKYANQGWVIMLTSFLGLTNGYLTVCLITAAPEGYKGPEQHALGNILVFCLLGGLFIGVLLDWLWLIGKGW